MEGVKSDRELRIVWNWPAPANGGGKKQRLFKTQFVRSWCRCRRCSSVVDSDVVVVAVAIAIDCLGQVGIAAGSVGQVESAMVMGGPEAGRRRWSSIKSR